MVSLLSSIDAVAKTLVKNNRQYSGSGHEKRKLVGEANTYLKDILDTASSVILVAMDKLSIGML